MRYQRTLIFPVGQQVCITSQGKKSNFGPKVLRKELSRPNMRQKCGNSPCSAHQWIRNWILPHFDPKLSSLGLLEAKIIVKWRVPGSYCHCCDFLRWWWWWFSGWWWCMSGWWWWFLWWSGGVYACYAFQRSYADLTPWIGLLWGVAKWVNLVIFFWQMDSISIKGAYPGYKKENKKMRFNPPHLNLIF